jgi:hypothetical protein
MHAVRVQYTVREDFVATNEANIRAVMDELRALGDVGVKYSAFRTGEGRTFVHVVVMEDESKGSIVPGLASFQRFRTALKGGVEVPPANESWTVVGTSFTV